jgi:hypothetical protein
MLGATGAHASAQNGRQRVLAPDVLRRVHAAEQGPRHRSIAGAGHHGHVMPIEVLWDWVPTTPSTALGWPASCAARPHTT